MLIRVNVSDGMLNQLSPYPHGVPTQSLVTASSLHTNFGKLLMELLTSQPASESLTMAGGYTNFIDPKLWWFIRVKIFDIHFYPRLALA